jgi:2-polyprenyl-3-methyl-5-hydroxy-6-metoxy-1,4-benzoquinol methylase
MLNFAYRGQSVALNEGEAWTPSADKDTYRDAPSGELWDIVREVQKGKAWRTVVSAKYAKAHPWLHRIITSPQRDYFFREHPPKRAGRVLDIGAGWGQIARPLAQTQHQVVALEPTPERLAFIRAAAEQDGVSKQMCFLQADFFDVEFSGGFDLVTCIGVLEWTPKFREGNPREIQLRFLRNAARSLAPDGEFVIGIENRFGLKYLLGAPDDHIATANIAVYDADLASEKWQKQSGQPLRSFTFTRAELQSLLAEAGFRQFEFFAALPDYKVPEKVIPLGPETNAFFASGGFVPEHDGCNGAPLGIQDELRSHYRSLAALGVVSDFAPSFFVKARL